MIAALAEICATPQKGPAPRSIALGIGDDAAAWQPSRSNLSVITSDALIDGVHFLAERMDARAIGHRAMAANLSDLAAMGARPVLATVVLGMPNAAARDAVLEAYRAMAALAGRFGARIVGGDIVRSPVLSFSITLVGEVARPRLKTRAAMRAGDVLAVTGPLGASRAGLELTLRSRDVGEDARTAALAAYGTPQPRVREGRWFAASTYVSAMMDLSDGISTDVARLARASGCGVVLDAVPVHAAARAVALAAGDDPDAYALDGGEDFELLVAIRPRAFTHLARAFAKRFATELIPIGRAVSGEGVRLRDERGERALVPAGWDHLAAREVLS